MTDAESEVAADDAAPEPLSDASELLYHQAIPAFCENGEPTTQVFRPARADEGMWSADRGSMSTPRQSFERHTSLFGLESLGTYGITVGEACAVRLATIPDPVSGNAAHVFVDFRALSGSQCKAKSKVLYRHAMGRGRLHPERTAEATAAG